MEQTAEEDGTVEEGVGGGGGGGSGVVGDGGRVSVLSSLVRLYWLYTHASQISFSKKYKVWINMTNFIFEKKL